MICSSRRHTKLSAWSAVYGPFNFNHTLLAPPGTQVLVHKIPDQRASFAPHSIKGWYIGPSMNHYHCFQCYITSLNSVQYDVTLDWFPRSTPFPHITADNYLLQISKDILSLLQNKTDNIIPFLTYCSKVNNAFIQVSHIIKRATAPPTAPLPSVTDPDPISIPA